MAAHSCSSGPLAEDLGRQTVPPAELEQVRVAKALGQQLLRQWPGLVDPTEVEERQDVGVEEGDRLGSGGDRLQERRRPVPALQGLCLGAGSVMKLAETHQDGGQPTACAASSTLGARQGALVERARFRMAALPEIEADEVGDGDGDARVLAAEGAPWISRARR